MNQKCEWALWIGVYVRDGKLIPTCTGHQLEASDVNHIWSIGRRPDFRSNLISLTYPAHRWFHDHLPLGRLLCVLAKLRKQSAFGDPLEFDLAEINAAAGKSVTGWMACTEIPEQEMWVRWLSECLRRLKELETARVK